MSEQSAPSTHESNSNVVEEQLDAEPRAFDLNSTVCNPVEIGLAEVTSTGEKTSVPAIFTLGGAQNSIHKLALVKFESDHGPDQFVLWGMIQREDGEYELSRDRAAGAQILPNQTKVVGRAHGVTDTVDVWPGDPKMDVSRRHLQVELRDGVLLASHISTSPGTETAIKGSTLVESDASANEEYITEEPLTSVEVTEDIALNNEVEEAQAEAAAQQAREEVAVEALPIDTPLVEAAEPEKPQESEVKLADLFKSPESIVQALNDSELDPGVKNQLRQVVDAWKQLKAARLSEEVWQDVIKPQLDQLDQPFDAVSRVGSRLQGELENLLSGFQLLATAVEYGDYETMGELGRRYRFVEAGQNILDGLKPVFTDEAVSGGVRKLNLELLESDDRVRAMRRGAYSMEFTEKDAAELMNNIHVTEASTSGEIRTQVLALDTKGAIRKYNQRKEYVEAVIAYAKAAGNTDASQNYPVINNRIQEELRRIFSNGSRMTSSDVHMLRGRIERDVLGPLREATRFTRVAALYQNEARK